MKFTKFLNKMLCALCIMVSVPKHLQPLVECPRRLNVYNPLSYLFVFGFAVWAACIEFGSVFRDIFCNIIRIGFQDNKIVNDHDYEG